MLGQALGGRVERNPFGREIGTERVSWVDRRRRHAFGINALGISVEPIAELNSDPNAAGLEDFLAHTTHLDSIVELPAGARVLATTERDPAAMVEFNERAWGVQFHPEMDEVAIRAYIEDRAGALRGEGLDVEQLLSNVQATPASHALLKQFARFCAGVSPSH
jgi:GMP synthase (glutamine-hydrolysing)